MYVLFARGLLSPAGHAAWTGLVCSILWRERLKAGKIQFNWQVLRTFIISILLHALWDTLQSLRGATFIEFINLELLSLVVAVVSLTLLNRQLKEARFNDPNGKNISELKQESESGML